MRRLLYTLCVCLGCEKRKRENTMLSMKETWEKVPATMKCMTFSLNQNSETEDTEEILQYLPSYKGKRVLELTSGVGRFTGSLAAEALHVTAVDFVQEYNNVNEKQNGHYGNITFLCADATEIDFPDGSFDLILSGWLYCNVDDQQMKLVMERSLKWLSPGGHISFRETCDTTDNLFDEGNRIPVVNLPTKNGGNIPKRNYLRTAAEYCHSLWITESNGAHFRKINLKNSQAYNKVGGCSLQVMYMAQREPIIDDRCRMGTSNEIFTHQFLSEMEWVLGHSWATLGGETALKKLISQTGVTHGDQVLNVGCGTGGSPFLLAKYYSAEVHAIDLSTNMICIAMEKQSKLDDIHRAKIQFEATDVSKKEFQEGYYDVIYCCNSLLYFSDNKKICEKFYRWLKPGGKLLIAETCQGKGSLSKGVQQILDSYAINVPPMEVYEKALEDSGFSDISVEDDTGNVIRSLKDELEAFIPTRETFTQLFSQDEFHELCKWGSTKLRWLESEQIAWGIFKAQK